VIGTIISAVIGIGSKIIGGVMDSQDADEANRVGLRLANMTRQDNLRVQAANERMGTLGLKHQKNVLKFQKKEAGLDRKEREKDRQYAKRENFKAENLDFVNKNATARNAFLNSVRRAT